MRSTPGCSLDGSSTASPANARPAGVQARALLCPSPVLPVFLSVSAHDLVPVAIAHGEHGAGLLVLLLQGGGVVVAFLARQR